MRPGVVFLQRERRIDESYEKQKVEHELKVELESFMEKARKLITNKTKCSGVLKTFPAFFLQFIQTINSVAK